MSHEISCWIHSFGFWIQMRVDKRNIKYFGDYITILCVVWRSKRNNIASAEPQKVPQDTIYRSSNSLTQEMRKKRRIVKRKRKIRKMSKTRSTRHILLWSCNSNVLLAHFHRKSSIFNFSKFIFLSVNGSAPQTKSKSDDYHKLRVFEFKPFDAFN